jgi:hypothetical protein
VRYIEVANWIDKQLADGWNITLNEPLGANRATLEKWKPEGVRGSGLEITLKQVDLILRGYRLGEMHDLFDSGRNYKGSHTEILGKAHPELG